MKVAIYARYSSDNQRDASIADQLRICRVHAEKQGWQIVEEYTDHAISGASLLRPGIQALIADATRGRFQIVLAEAMDRLSRDQQDIAGVYKRMSYSDVKIVTLSEGEVSHLHVGLKGTMNALFLKDLADKTRRGQRGRVEAGKSGGGNSYGYDVVKKFDASGEPIRGDRTINEPQANVVRRIFRDYAAGKSAKTIAFALNKEGIPSPSGGDWGFSTINGNPKRGNGILNNEMYVGKIVWNRQRFLKDPDTGKRQARPNPESEWVIQEAPELRILDDELWQAVKAHQARNSIDSDDRGSPNVAIVHTRPRPKYLFSGLTKCACCGGGYSAISATLIGCSTARNKGTCDNRVNIRRDELESRVLDALRTRMLDPAIFAEFCDAYTQEMNRLRMDARANIDAAEAEIGRIDREEQRLMDLYLKEAISLDAVTERGGKLKARKLELKNFLAGADEPPPVLHPAMAGQYRLRVQQLYETLQDDSEERRIEAADVLRTLVEDIILTPVDGRIEIDVRGDLAGILTIAVERKKPREGALLGSQVKMVAGAVTTIVFRCLVSSCYRSVSSTRLWQTPPAAPQYDHRRGGTFWIYGKLRYPPKPISKRIVSFARDPSGEDVVSGGMIVPRQEFAKLAAPTVGDATDGVGQPDLGVDALSLADSKRLWMLAAHCPDHSMAAKAFRPMRLGLPFASTRLVPARWPSVHLPPG